MKKPNLFFSCILVLLFPQLLFAQLVDKTPATAYSFGNVNDAISCDRSKTQRMISLNGQWDFSFALKPSDAPKDFYKSRMSGWKKIEVPSNWEMKGYDKQ